VYECLSGYDLQADGSCELVSRYAGCNTPDIRVGDYVVAACNVGASYAGTGASAYGNLFQWGRNQPFAAIGTVSTTTTKPATAARPYVGDDKFIVNSSSPYDWVGTKNDDLW
jgi:hypothetical protein